MNEKMIEAIKGVEIGVSSGRLKMSDVSDSSLSNMIDKCNLEYRKGNAVVSDDFYDHTLIAEQKRRNPDIEDELEIEPELISGKTVELPQRMLSTDKAYDAESIKKWITKVLAVGDTYVKVTPKLDGFATYDDGENLYTRGNGYRGTDITHVINRGIKIVGDARGMGPGEIVINKAYFEKRLADHFDNSRNVISSVIKEGELSPVIATAMAWGAVVFAPFAEINHIIVRDRREVENISDMIDKLWADLVDGSKYDTDGLVFEATSDSVKKEMGHTSHHHRWQIAYKRNTEYKDVKVLSITNQTGKTGVITPVAELDPTRISGAVLSRATCHNWGNVLKMGIGAGCTVRVFRSGLVIPYIEKVVEHTQTEAMPDKCPSCGAETELSKCGTHLSCTNNTDCSAQVEGIIEYWFKTLGNCDGFGPKVIADIVGYGVDKVKMIYDLNQANFENAGLGAGISANLLSELERSRTEQIEDWRFLAAFSIHNVGKGGCERLLKHHRLLDIFELTADDVVEIDGFAEKTAKILVDTLERIKPDFDYLHSLGFNLSETPLEGELEAVDSPISGKTIVVTGSLQTGSRNDIHDKIKSMGGIVGKAVSGKTDILVIGEKVGESKLKAATKHGTEVIAEKAFVEMMGD